MDRFRDFKHIWDGTQPGWVILRHTEDRERLKVMFERGASIHDLKALRAVLPALAHTPTNEMLALKGASHFDLGEHESAAARRLKALCFSQRLSVISDAYQFVGYGIFNEQTRTYLLIEDEALVRSVAAEAIRNGVPVRDSIV
jgi:hypothetical protein